MALRPHLFPYRTQKLSSIAPKVVGGSLPARIGRRDAHGRLAQLGEHLPYKQGVTGSIPVASIGESQGNKTVARRDKALPT